MELLITSYPNINICILGARLVAYLTTHKSAAENLVKVKSFLLEVLTKTILPSETKVSRVALKQLSPFLKLV